MALVTNGNFSIKNLYVDKPGAIAFLGSNVNIGNQVSMINGLLDLNNHNILLSPTGKINGETETSRVTGVNGGEIMITLNLNAPNGVNPGNLGALIVSAADLGAVTIKRGHKMQTGTGMTSSINRYFDVSPANNTNLGATLRINYFDAELNQQNENSMIMFRSTDNGANWANQSITSRDAGFNYVEKSGIPSFSRWTLSSAVSSALPVLGLEFYAKRVSNNKVQLDWKTVQEIDNLGFHIERKKENDTDFLSDGFVNAAVPGGNSSFPLEYSRIDSNSFPGKTYYRLKQEDINGHYAYSVIRLVNGEVNKSVTLKAWPIPSAGDLHVQVKGIDKPDILQVIDAAGKIIHQVAVTDNAQLTLGNIKPGAYFLRLANNKDIVQKFLVQ